MAGVARRPRPRPAKLAPVPTTPSARAARNRAAIQSHLGPAAAGVLAALDARLPLAPDPDRALNNLERLLATPAGQALGPELAAPDRRLLDALLMLLGVSQFFADTLAAYPAAVELVRRPAVPNPATAELVLELRGLVDAAPNDAAVLRAFRRFRHLHMLRVGVGDIVGERPLEEVTRELSRLADASVEVAMQVAARTVARKFGTPTAPGGRGAQRPLRRQGQRRREQGALGRVRLDPRRAGARGQDRTGPRPARQPREAVRAILAGERHARSAGAGGLAIDNVRHAVVEVRERLPLLVIDGKPNARDSKEGDATYLRPVFTAVLGGYAWNFGALADLEKQDLAATRWS